MTMISSWPIPTPEVPAHQGEARKFASGVFNTHCSCGWHSVTYRSASKAEAAFVSHVEAVVRFVRQPTAKESFTVASIERQFAARTHPNTHSTH